MARIPAITEGDVEAWVGARSFELGRDYAESGAIYEPRLQGTTLKARSSGQSGGPYRVRVSFDERGIAEAYCSCPVGADGHCKHIAALLLTWLASPDQFTALPETDAALEQRSKSELIALIKQMLRQEPDLELLLDTPLPVAAGRSQPVDPEMYRRQAAAAFRSADYEYGAEADLSARLLALTAIGEGFAEQRQFANAAAVYGAVAAEVLEHYESYEDEGGELGDVVRTCVDGLGASLGGVQDRGERETILRALFDVYTFDVDFGGVGLSDEVPGMILEQARTEERAMVAGWVRAALPEGGNFSATFARQTYGSFLLKLEADTLDDDAFLRICRETGRTTDLVDRLLALGRVEDAAHEASLAPDHILVDLAEIFVRHGQGETAERLVEARLAGSSDVRLIAWLRDRARAMGDLQAALQWATRFFHAQPSTTSYQEVRELARAQGAWEALRPELIAALKEPHRLYYLIQVYLDEGDVDAALAALPAITPQQIGSYYGATPHLQVAEAAEERRPAAARTIYQHHAEGLIERQGRDNYQQAARLLLKVRALSHALGDDEGWRGYIADLRARYNNRRALKEELARAGVE